MSIAKKSETKLILLLRMLGEVCIEPEHGWFHFNYCFPGEVDPKVLEKTYLNYRTNPSSHLEKAISAFHTLEPEIKKKLKGEIISACSSYYYHWDIPFPKRRLKDVEQDLDRLLG